MPEKSSEEGSFGLLHRQGRRDTGIFRHRRRRSLLCRAARPVLCLLLVCVLWGASAAMTLAYSDTSVLEGFAPQIVRVIFHNSSAAPGEGFKVDLHWQNVGDEPAPGDYWIFVHFRPEEALDEPYEPGGFSWDFAPARNTSRWQTGFVVKEESCYFRVPANIRPGKYTVLVGLYSRDGGLTRIPLQNRTRDVGAHRYRIGQVSVVEEPGMPGKVLAYRLIWRVREPRPEPPVREARFVSRGRNSVAFDPGRPIVRGWRLNGHDVPLGGDVALQGPEAEFVSLKDNRRHSSLALDADWHFASRITDDSAVYRCRLRYRMEEVARFDLRFQVTRGGIAVRMSGVKEGDGYHLLSVSLPSVVSVSAEAPGAGMAMSTEGGRLVNIAESGRHRQVQGVGLSDPVPAAAVISHQALAVGWVKSLDDRLITETMEADGRYGTLGVQFVHRIGASDNRHQFVPRKNSEFEVTLQTAEEGEALDWTDAAELISKHYRARPNPLYVNGLTYKIFLDEPTSTNPTTFAEAGDLIRRVHNLTNGNPQVVYLVGWQHNGHDTGYPDVLTANKRLGGLKGLKALIDQGDRLRALVSFHDNYDDAYMDSPGWKESSIALDGEGKPMKGGVWAGGQCYIISAPEYVNSGEAARRVSRTLSTYPIHTSVHLDVLSAASLRVDHHPDRFAGSDECYTARRAILDMWKKQKVDVTSEGLTAPYVGPITHFWHAAKRQEGGPYSAEEAIPFVPYILHGKATWGGALDPRYGVALSLLYGATFSEDWTKETTDQHICDRFYLVYLPWSRLAANSITGYERDGQVQRVHYGSDCTVEVDLEAGAYTVTENGYVIARDGLTTCPMGRHELAVYSTRAGRQVIPLPENWGATTRVRAEIIDSSGERHELMARVNSQGEVELDLPASRPVILTRR